MSTVVNDTIRIGASPRAKNSREILRAIDALRWSAAEVMREAFPGDLKQFALPRLPASTLSKARLGYFCGPFFRAGLCILALWVGGADRDRAQRLVDWLQELVDRLWPDAPEEKELRQLIRDAQEADTEEDRIETEFHLETPGSLRRWIRAIRRQRAADRSLLLALRAREAELSARKVVG